MQLEVKPESPERKETVKARGGASTNESGKVGPSRCFFFENLKTNEDLVKSS